MKNAIFLAALLCAALPLFAQPLNDIAHRRVVHEKPVLAWDILDERDILWQKTVWRVIDVREKINLPFIYPQAPFFEVLKKAAIEGELTLYAPDADDFSRPLSAQDLDQLLARYDTIEIWDESHKAPTLAVVANEIYYEDIKRYRIKEVWYFDSKKSSLGVRILGIAALRDVLDERGNFKYEKPLFWAHYPSARAVLARETVFVNDNDAARMTWEDLFEMRMFSSYISKESNVRNNRLQDLFSGVDLLLEADKIKQDIFNFEHYLWSHLHGRGAPNEAPRQLLSFVRQKTHVGRILLSRGRMRGYFCPFKKKRRPGGEMTHKTPGMILKKLLPLSLLLCCGGFLLAQKTATISLNGTVKDDSNGETLIGATILDLSTGNGTATNEYGFYSLALPISEDSISVEFSYVGYQSRTFRILPKKDQTLNVRLGTGIQLREVVVKANSYQERMRSTEMSVEEISTKEVKVIPALLGETDILKIIQLKPGIPSGSEGTTGLYVRGGAADQNLIVLDEAVVYNANHLFGFFSTFNTDAVKDLKLYKGGFPAQYGGRLSSVIDVRIKDGNNQRFAGTGGIGLITSRLTLEGPIQKDKSSFIVSGRRTYADVFTRMINKSNADNPDYNPIPDYYFYDLNTKVNFTLGEKDRLYLSGYFGRDVFGFEGDFFQFSFNWGNATGTARWNHVFSPKLFHNLTLTYSDYDYNIETKVTGFSFNVGSDVRDINLKSDFYYSLDNRHTLRYGSNVTRHSFGVGRLKASNDDGSISFSGGDDFTGFSFGAYVADEMSLGAHWKVNAGLRLSGFANDGKFFPGVEPRVAALYNVNPGLSFKGSYARMYQYLHLVSTAGLALPTDIWYPTTRLIKPQRSDQIAIGLEKLLGSRYLVTNEYYVKWLRRQVDFVDGARLFANNDLEQEFAIGRGYGYGMELGIEKQEGRLKGWAGYTLALVRRGKFEPIDDSRVFSGADGYFFPRYDRRHDLSLVLMYDVSRRITVSGTVVYGSGDRTWLPVGRFTFQDVYGGNFQPIVPVFGERNDFRLPYFMRTDLGLVYKFFPKWGESDLTFSVFNATNRRNAFFLYLEPQYPKGVDPEKDPLAIPTGVAAKQVSLFPIIGAFTWNFKF